VIVLANNSATARSAWLGRVRMLEDEGFKVQIFGNGTSVWIVATCR